MATVIEMLNDKFLEFGYMRNDEQRLGSYRTVKKFDDRREYYIDNVLFAINYMSRELHRFRYNRDLPLDKYRLVWTNVDNPYECIYKRISHNNLKHLEDKFAHVCEQDSRLNNLTGGRYDKEIQDIL